MILNVILSAVVTVIATIVNYFLSNAGMMIGMEFSGGEVTEKIGFGIDELTFYPLTDNYDYYVPKEINFHPLSFIITLIIVFGIISIIRYYIKRR
ncbi:MAG: hypothetical protein Q4D13_07245 [Erysipelotrichaceae bacterium]|nr:hypothetical protein [Erysipelotrichaceae bacterium]